MADYVATAETEINASTDEVWSALTEPEQIKKYMFGSQVVTDWSKVAHHLEGRVRGEEIRRQG